MQNQGSDPQGPHVIDDQPPKKSKLLEATLELGRNWALATALAAFSASMFTMEAIHGVAVYKRAIGFGGVMLATAWIALAIERAVQVSEWRVRTRRQKLLQFFATALLLVLGGAIVVAVASMSDNRRMVQVCDEYADRAESGVHNDPKCQRLYRERAELTERLNSIPVRKRDH